MKLSHKLLLGVAVGVVALLSTSIVTLRNHIDRVFSGTPEEKLFRVIPVEEFETADFSANWDVTIKQGTEYKLEVAVRDGNSYQPVIKNINGILYLSVDTVQSAGTNERIRARLTTPVLRALRSVRGTQVHLRNFQADSLIVSIEEGGLFNGVDNSIQNISFQSPRGTRIELKETSDF